MSPPPHPFQRLTRNRASLGNYASLWLGPDHLLLVSVVGYREEYRRFYFRDIQVLYLEPTRWRTYWAVIWGVPTLLFALFLLLVTDGAWGWMLFFISPLLALLTWNWALGPCCRTHIATAVQLTPLPPLSRLRKARKVLARLQPLIVAAQADLAASPPGPDVPAATAPAGEAGPVSVAETVSSALPPAP